MDAVTYPNAEVIEFIEENLIPLRVPYDAKPLSVDFNIKWTPTIIVLDGEGKEHQRSIGFLAPEELIPELLLGIAKTHYERDQFAKALARLEEILRTIPRAAQPRRHCT